MSYHTKMAIYLLYIASWAWGRTSHGFSILLATEAVPKILPNLNVVAHLVVPAGCGFCLLRLAIAKLIGVLCFSFKSLFLVTFNVRLGCFIRKALYLSFHHLPFRSSKCGTTL